MGERGSARRASVIRIFAYAGYIRDEQGRFALSDWAFCLTGRFFSLGEWKSQGFFLFLFARGGQRRAVGILVPFFFFLTPSSPSKAAEPPSKPFVKGKAEPRVQMSGSGEIHASFSPDQWASVAPPIGPL